MPKTVTLTPQPDSLVEIKVGLPAAEFERFINAAAKNLATAYRFKGFRPGTTPRAVVEQNLGQGRLRAEAAQAAVEKLYPEIITEQNLKPLGEPKIEITGLSESAALEFKVTLPVLSELKLPDFKAITVKRPVVSVTEEEVSQTLAHIRKSRATARAVERPSQKGDAVEIDFETRVGGVKVENGESRNHPFILGEGGFLPGFEEALVGLKAGEEKSFTLTAPANYYHPALAGKVLEFKVKIKLVQELELPPLTAAFAKSLGQFDSLEALKDSLKQGLAREKENEALAQAEAALVNQITRGAALSFPSQLVKAELDHMVLELQRRVTATGLDWPTYLGNIRKTEAALKADWQSQAAERVKTALVLEAIIEREAIAPTDEEIVARANQHLKRFKNLKQARRKVDPRALHRQVVGELKREKLLARLRQQIT